MDKIISDQEKKIKKKKIDVYDIHVSRARYPRPYIVLV